MLKEEEKKSTQETPKEMSEYMQTMCNLSDEMCKNTGENKENRGVLVLFFEKGETHTALRTCVFGDLKNLFSAMCRAMDDENCPMNDIIMKAMLTRAICAGGPELEKVFFDKEG